MAYSFSSELISEGYPNKVADQVSDTLLDQLLAYDSDTHCAIETFMTTGQVMTMEKVRSKEYVDLQTITRKTIKRIGYTKSEYWFDGDSCDIMSAIREQSEDVDRGVNRANGDKQGAGSQGVMFGYAINEAENYMPVSLGLARLIVRVLADIRKEGKEVTYLRPGPKSQVTIEYSDDHTPRRIHIIVAGTQYDEFDSDDDRMLARIKVDVINIFIPRVKAACDDKTRALFNDDILYYVNPTGKFVIDRPRGDTGLTGRRIIVDTHGGRGTHGGGTFSGRDPNKMGRSAAYASQYIAKNLVVAGVSDGVLVQIGYAIGEARPINIYVDTYGRGKVGMTDSEIAQKVDEMYDLRPKAIEEKFDLRNPICFEAAAYGHMGRQCEVKEKTFESRYHETEVMQVELFTWEKLDDVKRVKQTFGI